MGDSEHKYKSKLEGATGGIILIGIGVLFMVDSIDFWPWILAVIGVAILPGSIAQEGLWAGMQGSVWLIGLAILFSLDAIWPGILILVGLSIIAGALVQPPMMAGKAKRSHSSPDDDDA